MTTTTDHLRAVAAVFLVALLMLPLAGCRNSDSGAEPVPVPAPTQDYSQPDDLSGYPDEPSDYGDEPSAYGDPSGYGDESGDYTGEEGSSTNPCAFPGDPLCPDTPITVPPPNLTPPF